MEPQNLPAIIVHLDPMAAFQLLLVTKKEHHYSTVELSLVLIGIWSDLVKQFPEIDHLLTTGYLSEVQKIEKAKLIFGIEP
jgi:hypothetical protein